MYLLLLGRDHGRYDLAVRCVLVEAVGRVKIQIVVGCSGLAAPRECLRRVRHTVGAARWVRLRAGHPLEHLGGHRLAGLVRLRGQELLSLLVTAGRAVLS